eukprot:NODE_2817_length_400_cov_13.222222_g2735_i0.p1 GENE.NODE_2817_length_400_cov_13.222222_g2735_i0~~NODE_2817_length_400_cov_13.222222_g2735_i0.p1  ORF type:complete len:63 (-),score=7.56 NODE_2817_length_400_cov_13.222222_g2735_i0:11-199(-)
MYSALIPLLLRSTKTTGQSFHQAHAMPLYEYQFSIQRPSFHTQAYAFVPMFVWRNVCFVCKQ